MFQSTTLNYISLISSDSNYTATDNYILPVPVAEAAAVEEEDCGTPFVRVLVVVEEALSVPAEMMDTVPEVAMGDIHTDSETVDILADSAVAGNLVDSEVVHIPADSVGGVAGEDRNTQTEVVAENNYKYWIEALRVFELAEGFEGEVCFRS